MRIAVITGASSGMGRELALQINDEIPNIEEIWLIGRREDRLKELSRLLTKNVRIICMDLSNASSWDKYEKLLEMEKAKIVFLVNAAGFGQIGSVSKLPLSSQLDICQLNITALSAMCRISLPYMAEHSRIVNFASAAAFLPQPDFAVYAASKSYVLSLSRALNQELRGSGCTVCAVCPGPVNTEFFDIAERSGKAPAYKQLFMSECRAVARKALIDSVLGKDISVYGLPMNIFAVLSRLPHGAILRAIGAVRGRIR